jgi:hypothetical protein
MWKVTGMVIGLVLTSMPLRAEPSNYAQGVADWRALKAWLDSQSSLGKGNAAGANYWAANRNVPGHASCLTAAEDYRSLRHGEASAFLAGCQGCQGPARSARHEATCRRSIPQGVQ